MIRQALNKDRIIVAEVDGTLNGFCEFKPPSYSKGRLFAKIENIAVLKDRQNQGIGYALFSWLLNKYVYICLYCPVDIPANEVYKRWGGQLIRQEKGNKRPLNVWGFKRHGES